MSEPNSRKTAAQWRRAAKNTGKPDAYRRSVLIRNKTITSIQSGAPTPRGAETVGTPCASRIAFRRQPFPQSSAERGNAQERRPGDLSNMTGPALACGPEIHRKTSCAEICAEIEHTGHARRHTSARSRRSLQGPGHRRLQYKCVGKLIVRHWLPPLGLRLRRWQGRPSDVPRPPR